MRGGTFLSSCMKPDTNRKLRCFFTAQLVVSAIFSLVFFIFASFHAAVSAFLGGCVSWIPGLLFASVLFKYKGAKNSAKIAKAFYLGEVLKLTVSGILFTLIFSTIDVHALAFFLTFIFVQALYWCAPLIIT